MELNSRCICATVTIIVLVVIFLVSLGLTVRYSRDLQEPYSVSDFHRFKPSSSLEQFFCPNNELSTKLHDVCQGISNADQNFELYSIDNFEGQPPKYMEQNLTLHDSRRLDPLEHHTFALHGVLPGSYFDVTPCVRWMHNSEIRDGHNASTFVMIIRGARNLSTVQQNLSPDKTIDQICNDHCLNFTQFQNDKSCAIIPSGDPNCTLCTYASTWDDYNFLVYNPQRKGTVVVHTVINLHRQHWDILAMGGRQITSKCGQNDTRFDRCTLESQKTTSYFVSFRFTNDNPGGEQCTINMEYKCEINWIFAFVVACFVALAIVMICCCCVVCQGEKCYGYTTMRDNGDGNE